MNLVDQRVNRNRGIHPRVSETAQVLESLFLHDSSPSLSLSLSRVTVKLGVLRRRFPRVIYIDRLYKEEGRKGVGRASGVPFFEATTSRRDG